MLERGEKATVAAVHRELGGGSFSTLSPIMKDWRQGREAAAALPPGLDALAELTKLWEAAWRAADRYHEAAREGWERERAALMVEISEREEIIAVIEEEMAAMSDARDRASHEAAEATRQATALAQNLTLATTRAEAAITEREAWIEALRPSSELAPERPASPH